MAADDDLTQVLAPTPFQSLGLNLKSRTGTAVTSDEKEVAYKRKHFAESVAHA